MHILNCIPSRFKNVNDRLKRQKCLFGWFEGEALSVLFRSKRVFFRVADFFDFFLLRVWVDQTKQELRDLHVFSRSDDVARLQTQNTVLAKMVRKVLLSSWIELSGNPWVTANCPIILRKTSCTISEFGSSSPGGDIDETIRIIVILGVGVGWGFCI